MASPSGHTVTGLTVGAAYTAVAVVWRETGAPAVAVTGDGVTFGSPITATETWVVSRVTFEATATSHLVGIIRTDSGVGRAYIGGVALIPVKSVSDPYEGPFFGGDTTDPDYDRRWTGTADASTSTSTPIGAIWRPTGRAPHTEILFQSDAFLPGTDRITVWRSCEDQRMKVRGGVRLAAADGVAVLDYEVPFSRDVDYQAETFDSGGVSLGFTPSSKVHLPIDEVWIANVMEPSRALKYMLSAAALPELTEATPGEAFTPEGEYLPRWVGGRAGGLRGVNLSGYTSTFADAELLKSMFGTASEQKLPILVVRTPPQMLLPPTFIAEVAQRTRRPVNTHLGGEWVEWLMVGDETSPPFPGVSEPVITWDDVAARYATWDEVATAYPTWLDLSRDYSLIGAA